MWGAEVCPVIRVRREKSHLGKHYPIRGGHQIIGCSGLLRWIRLYLRGWKDARRYGGTGSQWDPWDGSIQGHQWTLAFFSQLKRYFAHISNFTSGIHGLEPFSFTTLGKMYSEHCTLIHFNSMKLCFLFLDSVACLVITYEGCVSAFCHLRKTLLTLLCQSVQMLCQSAVQKRGKTQMKRNNNCPYWNDLYSKNWLSWSEETNFILRFRQCQLRLLLYPSTWRKVAFAKPWPWNSHKYMEKSKKLDQFWYHTITVSIDTIEAIMKH